jgi:hypothetical protein
VSYLWLAKRGHPGAGQAKVGKRLKLPANKVHRDRKNDYARQPKHRKVGDSLA